MKTKRNLLILFGLLIIAQLFIPIKMIIDSENVLVSGKAFRFRSAPVDPHDPFRGRYITLNFAINNFPCDSAQGWRSGEKAYVSLTHDTSGFAMVSGIYRDVPWEFKDYVEVEVNYVYQYDTTCIVYFNYPFNKFYMEEFTAPEAEKLYNEMLRDSSAVTYALVYVKEGVGLISDVMINDKSIVEY